jgi:AAA-like domain
MSQPILQKVNELLAPDRLSYIQEIVFLGAWEGKRYRQIADESGYDYDYVKEVGFQLWQSCSDVLGRKVTKKNVRLLLAETSSPADSFSNFPIMAAPSSFEFPGGPLSLDSPFYVERYAIEPIAYREILKPGGLVRIKAAQQSGKTSLVLRLMAHAQANGLMPVVVNLQIADQRLLSNLNHFLRWLCLHVSRQLNLEPQLDQYWDEESGSKLSCNAYFERFLLNQIESGIVLVFDEVTPLFDYPELAQDVLPLFRIWHEYAAQSKVWQKLRLIVVHNTELFVPLKLNQSPFNVGVPIELSDLTLEQISGLAQQYQLQQIQPEDLEPLIELVGGHPYLIQLAFYWLQQNLPIEQLIEQAPTMTGIYRSELQRQWNRLQQNPGLLNAFKQILLEANSTGIDMITAYKLESLGLIHRNGNQLAVRCGLYRKFFQVQLE